MASVVGTPTVASKRGTVAVVLDPDVATVFGDSESVNRALRELADVAARRLSASVMSIEWWWW